MDYSKLQNGSDIRGVALEGIEGQHVNLTEAACRDIGRGFALWLQAKTGKTSIRVAVGRDSRLSGQTLSGWICDAMVQQGLLVTDFGMASTPAMFMATVTEGYLFDGSVMITASHLPFNRNGFKFFTAQGGLEKGDIKEILAYAAGSEATALPEGTLATGQFMDAYAAILADKIRQATGEDKPLEGFKIVVDAGNGAGGFYVDKVLQPLGTITDGSRYLDPDGSFPNHIPNPEDKAAMQSITDAVRQAGADLGIIFDTDVDRAGAVLSDGRIKPQPHHRNAGCHFAAGASRHHHRHRFHHLHRPGQVHCRKGRHPPPLQAGLPQRHQRIHPPERSGPGQPACH